MIKNPHTQTQRDPSQNFYTSYAEALENCPSNAYQGDDVVACVVEKNRILRAQLSNNPTVDLGAARSLIGLAGIQGIDHLKILDFGGSAGYHYTISKLVLSRTSHVSWAVVETAAMMNKAKVMENDELKFFDNIDSAAHSLGKVDIVFTSSALQYVESPSNVLRKLLEIRAPRVFITRTPFNHEDEILIRIQKSRLSHNGPGELPIGFTDREVFYPATFERLATIEELIRNCGYVIRYRMIEEAGYQGRNGPIYMFGYLAELAS